MPAILYWFMVLLIGLSLAGLAYSIPREKNRAQIAALAVVTVLFGLVLFLISNFDRPYSGVLKLKPSAMRIVEQDVSEDYAETYNTELPCNAEGQPVESATAIPLRPPRHPALQRRSERPQRSADRQPVPARPLVHNQGKFLLGVDDGALGVYDGEAPLRLSR